MEHTLIPYKDVYKEISFSETLELLSFLRKIVDSTLLFPKDQELMEQEYELLESLVLDGFLPVQNIKSVRDSFSPEI